MTSSIPGGGFAAISVEQFTTIDDYAQDLAQEKGAIAGVVVLNEVPGVLTVSFQSEETGLSVGGIRIGFDGEILATADSAMELELLSTLPLAA